MDKAHPLSTPMIVRSLDVKKDPFRPREDNEEILGPEVPYLSAIGALMYLANCSQILPLLLIYLQDTALSQQKKNTGRE